VKRLQGWESRLDAVVSRARGRAYALGQCDCFRVACEALEALTGVDRWPDFAGRYRTPRQAKALLARHGRSFEAAFDSFFGARRCDVRRARRGDIVAFQTDDGEKHLGVCLGVNVAVTLEGGAGFVPTLSGLCAWRIG